jgi:hypothetical protein
VTIADRETAEVTAPMPFFNFDYRYGISENWRLDAVIGWLDLEIGVAATDYTGSAKVDILRGGSFGKARW